MDANEKIVELQENGFRVLKSHFPAALIDSCRQAFWPTLLAYLRTHTEQPNRGPHRHFLPMPFAPPCFNPQFFFHRDIISIVRGVMDERIVADQWSCDAPVLGSLHQEAHIDYQRPLFAEVPDLALPAFAIVVSFGLVPITLDNGPIEITPGTHRLPREKALQAVRSSQTNMHAVPLEIGDVLIRHPWALHRGTPNKTETPRALVTIRYVRRWYTDSSRQVNSIPLAVWRSLTAEQQSVMRFPIADQPDTLPSTNR